MAHKYSFYVSSTFQKTYVILMKAHHQLSITLCIYIRSNSNAFLYPLTHLQRLSLKPLVIISSLMALLVSQLVLLNLYYGYYKTYILLRVDCREILDERLQGPRGQSQAHTVLLRLDLNIILYPLLCFCLKTDNLVHLPELLWQEVEELDPSVQKAASCEVE